MDPYEEKTLRQPRYSVKKIRRLMRQLDIHNAFEYSPSDITQALITARQHYKHIKKMRRRIEKNFKRALLKHKRGHEGCQSTANADHLPTPSNNEP